MKYIFILGYNPTLSVAEILSVLDNTNINYTINTLSKEALVLDTQKIIEKTAEFINRLGGVIKIAEVIAEEENTGQYSEIFQNEKNNRILFDNFLKMSVSSTSKKFHWGISVYFLTEESPSFKKETSKDVQTSLFAAKRNFTKEKISVRIILPPKGKEHLDSASVFNNKIIEKGGEILILMGAQKIYLAKTIAIQNFESYGLRDYGRPCRDMKVGMMPPKLAQIMLNLAGANQRETILDPFCGTGVVLQEALLIDCKAKGSDITDKILDYSRQNLKWLENTFKLKNAEYELFKRDARDISKVVADNSISAIVTEGTLGPKYANRKPNTQETQYNFKQLELIYVPAFKEFAKILKKNGKIVISFPFYRINEQNTALAPFIDKIAATGYNILCPIKNKEFSKYPFIEITARNTILYSRPDQIVGREIIIFRKK